ncbi:hypothetical protein ACHAW5_007730 [Stephanodiscus triporus]|uniref:RRM domain-containing protein n=1 Tax=Stephanodiscus triporus TaxID=2934178 RepID=A0ABD3PQ12_9STRA
MNLDRAFALLLASIGAVAGFTPSGRVAFSVASSQSSRAASVPNVRVASVLSSEVEQSAESSAAPAFETAIHVGNISFDTRESDLRDVFSAYGSVSKVNMPIDRETGRPRGFAFVNMSSAEEHAAAIEALNESEVGGRTIYVSESVPKEKYAANKNKFDGPRKRTTPRGPRGTKIYVGNLNFDTTMEDIQAAFSEYGEVKDCFVPSDYDGNPRGFAFVTLDDDNALKAIEGLDGTELGGRTLNVKKSLPKESKPRDRY